MKKLFAWLSVALLSLFFLVGCGTSAKQEAPAPAQQATTQSTQSTQSKQSAQVVESGTYTDKDRVAAYVHQFKKLPSNYITKKEAEKLGWKEKGTLDKIAPGKSIGGDRYGNFEKILPDKEGRTWKEADIDYVKGDRNGKRIVFSNDGLIYYTDDHYKSFKKLY